jgi:tRNA modification GTPase
MRISAFEPIAAIATAPGSGGVGIVRVSGSELSGIAAKFLGRVPVPRKIHYVDFLADDTTVIDRGLLIYFKAPSSFTGEDVLELHGHGGQVVLQMLLQRTVQLGARLAEPGEFSRRAFLNGKIDLAQAEAVADLIAATTTAAARSAVRSLSGDFSAAVTDLTQRVIDLRMLIEAAIDFPEEEIDFVSRANVSQRIKDTREALSKLLARAQQGSLLRSGLRVVLAGLPNAGKSSLLNRLAGHDRALVTAIAGTTRDAIKETIQIEGIPLHITDTAGLRQSDDLVEQLGIERTWAEIEGADLIVQVVDGLVGMLQPDMDLVSVFPAAIKRIVVVNKIDLLGKDPSADVVSGVVHINLSAQTGAGISLLQAEMLKNAGWAGAGEDVILARERHLIALRTAADRLTFALETLGQMEFCAEELRLAQIALSDITGEFTSDDLLGEIFSRFCIGK